MSDLLFEIGTEEIPAGFVVPALEHLQNAFATYAADRHISHGEIRTLGTPRRLAIIVSGLSEKQDDITEEFMGPSAKAGLDADGNYTKAAMGFARSKGADVADLQVAETDKGEYLKLVREVKGADVAVLLPGILEEMISSLSFPKSMRWATTTRSFARPLQWIVALLGGKVVPVAFEGISSGAISMGHRFLANREISFSSAGEYEKKLEGAMVIADIDRRRRMVLESVRAAAAGAEELAGGEVAVDEDLLETVTHLVEYPQGVCGTFDEKFLELPDDVLVTSMRVNQKYFPIVDTTGRLMAGFVAVNNTVMDDVTQTRKGHQRVLRARLEDALFFFESDKAKSLDSFVPQLSGIVFQAKLGTMLEKTERIRALSRLLCGKVNPSLTADAERAAFLCKADLLTEMVGEFPSLQGVMGEAYALASGESPAVALAVKEHYMPKRAGAENPTSESGAIVGLADRIDTLAGCFGVGLKPTGTADPFGLRRLALGVLQLIQDFSFVLSLDEIFRAALALYGDKVKNDDATLAVIIGFLEGRYRNDWVARGVPGEVVLAATSVHFDDVNDCSQRITALDEIRKEASFPILAGSYKRIRNIIKENAATEIQTSLMAEPEEKALYDNLLALQEKMEPLLDRKAYPEAARLLLEVKEPLDTFFDRVMVMAEDAAVRRNRLNLLTALGNQVLRIGDISRMTEA